MVAVVAFQQQVGPTAAEIAAGVTPTNEAYLPYTFLRYGADPTGVADSTTAINHCFAAAAAAKYSQVRTGWPGGSFLVAGSINWPVDMAGFDGEGAHFNCTNTSDFAILPTYTTVDGITGDLVALIKSHPWIRSTFSGPCTTSNYSGIASSGLCDFTDRTNPGSPSMPGVTFRDGGSWGFYTHFKYGSGAFFNLIDNWDFDISGTGCANFQFLYFPSGTNSGERNGIQNSRFGYTIPTNVAAGAAGINHANGNADTRLISCSFNGGNSTNQRFWTVTGGTLNMTECHFESDTDAEYWGVLTGTNSAAIIDHWTVTLDAAKTKPVFNCDSSVTTGGFGIGWGSYLGASNTCPLVDGTGRVFALCSPTFLSGGNSIAYLSAYLNQFSDPIFASNTLTRDGWTATGTTPPAVEGTNPFSGTKDVQFHMTTGQTNYITSRKLTCEVGERVHAKVQMALTGFTAGTTFTAQIQYMAADGSALVTETIASIAATMGYAPYATNVSGGVGGAPAGTAWAQIQIAIQGGTTGALGYLGQVIANVA